MKSPTFEEITEKSSPVKSDMDSEVERLRASIAKLTSSSTNKLEKLIAEVEGLCNNNAQVAVPLCKMPTPLLPSDMHWHRAVGLGQ